MASRLVEKACLSAKGLLGKVRKIFEKVKEPPKGGQRGVKEISIADCLMSALAMFSYFHVMIAYSISVKFML